MEWMLLPLKRYADFSGRSRRMEYWMYSLGIFLLYMVMAIAMMSFGGMMFFGATQNPGAMAAAGGSLMLFMGIFGLVWLGLIIPSIAVSVRRLHDIDRSGWWLLAPSGLMLVGALLRSSMALAMIFNLAGFIASIALIVFMFLDGTPGQNRFGPDPKGRGASEVFA